MARTLIARSLHRLLSVLSDLGGLENASSKTRKTLEWELKELGLLGCPFSPDDYRRVLEAWLGIRIDVVEVPDFDFYTSREVLEADAHGAEVAYSPERKEALVLVQRGLRRAPWPTLDLALYHELSHLAAGHHKLHRATTESSRTNGMAALEVEARQRAKWLVVCGTFASLSVPTDLDRVA